MKDLSYKNEYKRLPVICLLCNTKIHKTVNAISYYENHHRRSFAQAIALLNFRRWRRCNGRRFRGGPLPLRPLR